MKHLICIGILAVACASCVYKKGNAENPEQSGDTLKTVSMNRKETNSIYYWKTIFKLDDYERQFLSEHQIGRMYIRFFDVTGTEYDNPEPIATIIFKETPPENLEIVPTVFIRNDIFKNSFFSDTIVDKIVKRILVMAETNDIKNVHEIQIDCDWTQSTEGTYFKSLEKMKNILHEKNILLSTTIRLHQFSLPEPPVDRGILMCYNTGRLKDSKSINSILNASDVKPYVKNIDNYQLPMDVAYPAFSWAIWFHIGDEFKSILRSADKTNTNYYYNKLKSPNLYIVKEDHYIDGNYISKGDEIRFEESDIKEILAVKQMLDHKFKNASIILYHLDSNNLSKFSTDEINQIYTH